MKKSSVFGMERYVEGSINDFIQNLKNENAAVIFGESEYSVGILHHYFLRRLPLSAWPALEQKLRSQSSFYPPDASAWEWMKPENISRCPNPPVWSLGVASFHPSGYVREAALGRLIQNWAGDELPYLILRASDWVASIRSLALAACYERIREDYAGHWIRSLPLMTALAGRGTPHFLEMTEQVEIFLLQPPHRQWLTNLIPATKDDRAAVRLALRLQGGELEKIITTMISSSAPFRQMAVQALSEHDLPLRFVDTSAMTLLSDSNASIRKGAFSVILARLPHRREAMLYRSLKDSSKGIREAARFYLKRDGVHAFAEYYRAELKERHRDDLAAVISGLGETGDRTDVDLIRSFLVHSNSQVRSSALAALEKLAQREVISDCFDALADRSHLVIRTAVNLLKGYWFEIDRDRLWLLYRRLPKLARR